MAFEFNNPLLYELREGSALDPFVPLSTTSVITSNKIVLTELPNQFEGVTISGYAESKSPSELIATTFYCNYLNGILSFASSENGKTVTASYKGRGVIQIPAERIYTKSVDGSSTETFQQIADSVGNASTVLGNLNSSIATGNTTNSNLISSISSANITKTNLNDMNIIAIATEASLSSANVVASEATRVQNESARIINEGIRVNSEVARVNAENIRKSAEDGRLPAEINRNNAESARIIAENLRIAQNNNTINAENIRLSSEIIRESNEDVRIENEGVRESQEENRQNTYSTSYVKFKGVVTGKTSLPASGNILGDTYQVIDDAITSNNAMWRYNGSEFEKSYVLDLTFAGGYGGNNSQVFTATENQTVFTLTEFPYLVNVNQLMVYVTGIKQIIGVNYTETSTNSFTLTSGVVAGTKVEAFRSVPGGAGSITTQEVENARVSSLGIGYPNLKARLDDHDSNKVGILANLNTSVKTDIVSSVNEVNNARLSDKAQTASELNLKAPQSALDDEKARINNLVSVADASFYQKSTVETTGALLVVESGATTGQINLASVTPLATGYTAVAGDYVLLVYGVSSGSAELIDLRVGTDGFIDISAGVGLRRQINVINDAIFDTEITSTSVDKNDTLTKTDYCYVNQWYTPATAYNILYYPVTVGKTYKVSGTTFGTAKTVVLAVNTGNAGDAFVVDSSEAGSGSRTINLEFSIPIGYAYIAISTPIGTVLSVKESGVLRKLRIEELIDGRIGADGVVDISVGEGMRRQFNNLKSEADTLNDAVFNSEILFTTAINNDGALDKPGYYYSSQWYVPDPAYALYYYPVTVGKTYKVTGTTFGTAKTVVLAVNTANSGNTVIVDATEPTTGVNRAISLEVTIPVGYAYIALSFPYELVFTVYEGTISRVPKLANKDFRYFVVDKNGNGDFTSIRSAVLFIINNFPDRGVVPTTIFIKNGVYVENPTVAAPYAAIPNYATKTSFIGESRDGVIINSTCTATAQGKCLEIGGECTVENLTINQLNDGFTIENNLGHNPYALHNDNAPVDNTKPYYTTVKNCKLYSECYMPVGAGLHHNQTQRYENVECIFNSEVTSEQGALYVHGCANPASIANGVEIDNCTLISKNGTRALSLPNVVGSQQYTDIPVSIKRTIGVTTGGAVSNVSKVTHDITIDSALNNVTDWNY